jgi:regulator of nonsense transcripts 2
LHDIGGSDTDSGSGTIDQDGHDEEELDEENHDDRCDTEDEDDDGGGPASDEDDEVHVRQKFAEADPHEVASFEQELRAVMQARYKLLLFFAHSCMCLSLNSEYNIHRHLYTPTVCLIHM